MHTVVLIVAAGRGERFGSSLPKQYADLNGKPVVRHAIEAFIRHPRIDGIRVVIGAGDEALYRQATAGLDLLAPVVGGGARQDTVRRGLESLVELEPECVLIHDAARPLVSAAVIDRVVGALDASHGRAAGPAGGRQPEAGRGRAGRRGGRARWPGAGADAAGLPVRGDPGGASRRHRLRLYRRYRDRRRGRARGRGRGRRGAQHEAHPARGPGGRRAVPGRPDPMAHGPRASTSTRSRPNDR